MIWIKGISTSIVNEMKNEGFIFETKISSYDMEDGTTDYNDIIIRDAIVKYYSFGDIDESSHETIVLDQRGKKFIIYHNDFINLECGV